MAEPASVAAPDPTPDAPNAYEAAPTERGWGKLLLALAAFVFIPKIPQISAMLPVEQTMLLFVPALAACVADSSYERARATVDTTTAYRDRVVRLEEQVGLASDALRNSLLVHGTC